MSSTQEKRGEQMARAREAAREITHDRTERARVVGEHHRAGILEAAQRGAWSLVSAVGRTLGVARDTAAQNKPGEYGDATAERATEAKDATVEKARETKDASKQQTEELKETTETTHMGADKARDSAAATARSPEQKLEEYKDSASDAARKATHGEERGGQGTARLKQGERGGDAARQRCEQVAGKEED